MIAVDTNVLVYAHRPEYPLHEPARQLLGRLAAGAAPWALPWPCLHEFYAKVTNPRIHRPTSSPGEAWDQVDAWITAPTATLLTEGADHVRQLRALTIAAGVTGALVHDARIAAICLSHGVTELVTMDRDFARFPALRTRSLLA